MDRALFGGRGRAVILIPEIPYQLEPIGRKLHDRWRRKRNFAIIVAAEGAAPVGGEMIFKASEDGREPRLGGIAERLAVDLNRLTGYEKLARWCWDTCSAAASRRLPTDCLRPGSAPQRHPRHRVRKKNVMVALQSENITTVRSRCDPQTQTGPARLRRHQVGARSGSLFRRRIICGGRLCEISALR